LLPAATMQILSGKANCLMCMAFHHLLTPVQGHHSHTLLGSSD